MTETYYYGMTGDYVFRGSVLDSVPEHFRPVVVIDPEDAESVERLTGCLAVNGANPNDRNYWRETQAALREFATPTLKPCAAAVTVDEVVRPCELGGDHDGEHSVHHGRTRVTWGA